MKAPAQADLQRWSDEVARDPRSLAFLPLARAYRRQGLRDAAMKLCLRGLEAYPSHAEAHGLLALLYLEAGDTTRAADEWSMVLRVDADNFEALRGMGFCYLEQDQLSRARQTLERAALLRPTDTAVQEALNVLGTRQELTQQGIARTAAAATGDDPWAAPAAPAAPSAATAAPTGSPAGAPSGGDTARGAAAAQTGAGDQAGAAARPQPATAPQTDATAGARAAASTGMTASAPSTGAATAGTSRPSAGASAGVLPEDPTLLFDELLATGPLLGALLVDGQGMVLAGRLTEGVAGDAAVLGAVLGGAIGEATRAATHLELGQWRGILLDADHALLHLARAGDDAVVVLAARRNAPAGWMLRAASQAVEQAVHYLEAYA